MYKQILSFLLCIVMILSFSVVSFAEDDRIPEAGDHIFFGHYEQDNDLNNGPEPIEWRVLEVKGKQMLILSEYILDAIPFNEGDGGNQWSNSSLRQWLNDYFMDNAYTEEESGVILLTEVDNSAKQTNYLTSGTPSTEDFIFLLSEAEVMSYFNSPNHSRGVATNYAKPKLVSIWIVNSLNGNFRSLGTFTEETTYEDEEYAPWWFRSPSYSWDTILGAYNGDGSGGSAWHKNTLNGRTYYYPSSIGVRPAMWVDINQYLDLLPEQEPEVTSVELIAITCDESIKAFTVLGDTTWKMWLPDGFVADELTEADLAENYIGYYLRDDDIIAVQYYDNTYSLADWQNELANRGFTVKGLYQINGAEAVLYQNEEEDFLTASVLDGKGKLLEVSFYPYSKMAEEADTVISSIQQETSRRKLSGAGGNTKTTSDSATTAEPVGKAFASQEEAYKAMVDAYKAGNYSDSYSYYEQAKGYQDADKYGNLLKARLCYDLKLKDSEIESLEKAIVNDIDFADSKDVLVCNSKMAHFYLLGYWRTSNGMHGYEVRSDWYSNTTVPAIPKSGDYYTILDGTYWSYFDGKWDDRVAQYKFSPITKSKMEMYSYQAKQSYTFSKIR